MIGVCLGKKGASGKLIQSTGEFALNIVGEELKEAALRCGSSVWILAMRSGRIVERGSFDELMAAKGYFYSLYNVFQS